MPLRIVTSPQACAGDQAAVTVCVLALHRWRTHRSPEYYVNFRRFKLPVSLESAKRRCYKALSRYNETQAHMETLRELCIDVYQRHHARKLAAWYTARLVLCLVYTQLNTLLSALGLADTACCIVV